MIVKSLKALQKYGLISTAKFFSNYIKRRRFATRHKQGALSWDTYKKHFEIKGSLHEIYTSCRTPILNLDTHTKIVKTLPLHESVIFEDRRIALFNHNWHMDILSGKASSHDSYFAHINLHQLDYDVKGVWEPSRFGHCAAYAKAYNATQSDVYADYFVRDVTSWIETNPPLYGANWMNPMEVAIRAINWIVTFTHFQSSPRIGDDVQFQELFTRSLLDHAYFLEHNWEVYLKNNNHFIADLLGFLYLCIFFKSISHFKHKIHWCHKALLKEFFSLIQNDGSLYEGSTNYHKLVTEMFVHFRALCEQEGLPLSSTFYVRLKKMLEFLEWCTDQGGNLVQVGDNDSGKLTTGLAIAPSAQTGVQHFAQFGLTIIKTKDAHVSFRHPTYDARQPSGHFHHDELAITISWKGTPLFVDPGTGTYNSGQAVRNNFRSSAKHNGAHVPELEDCFPSRFGLNRPNQKDTALIEDFERFVSIKNYTNKYISHGIVLHRSLNFNYTTQTIIIHDWVNNSNNKQCARVWNWILHPSLDVRASNPHEIELICKAQRVARFKSSREMTIAYETYSPHYASIVKTHALQCSAPLAEEARFELAFER